MNIESSTLWHPNPESQQVCEMGRCPSASPEWDASAWSNCSAPCGLGKRFRLVKCVASGVQVQDGECEGASRPQAEEVCDMGSCATSTWFFSEWAQQVRMERGGRGEANNVSKIGKKKEKEKEKKVLDEESE